MAFEITGKLIEKYETQQVSEKFKKREFVIETSDSNGGMNFTEYIKFQLTQDRCSALDRVNTNDDIKVSFNIRGRKWEKDGNVNYFTNLEAWRIEKMGGSDAPPSNSYDYSDADIPPAQEDDDLPF